jgi:hypothetical protein
MAAAPAYVRERRAFSGMGGILCKLIVTRCFLALFLPSDDKGIICDARWEASMESKYYFLPEELSPRMAESLFLSAYWHLAAIR